MEISSLAFASPFRSDIAILAVAYVLEIYSFQGVGFVCDFPTFVMLGFDVFDEAGISREWPIDSGYCV